MKTPIPGSAPSLAKPPSGFNSESEAGVAGSSIAHESALAQVSGSAPYVDDLTEVRGTLYAAPILSAVAHGRLLGVDTRAALAMPGVVDVVLAADVPGDLHLPVLANDEVVFPTDTVHYVGQVIGLVVATSVMQARHAARRVAVRIQALPAVLDVHQARAAGSYVLPPVFVRRGDVAQALAQAPHTLTGTLQAGGQEHFYLEGQIAYALPQEQNQWQVYSSTQHPGEVQHWVAHALGVENNAVRVECRRMGGAFGGKETQAGHVAVWAAVAAHKVGRAVKLRLDRDDDFMITGKRHPFAFEYTVGFDDSGRLAALKVMMAANCGYSADLSGAVADRAIFQLDNAYFLPHVEIASYRCRTHTQSHTAFRGFGAPQAVILIETIIGDIARHLQMDALDVRYRNLYSDDDDRNTTHFGMRVEDNILPALLPRLERSAQYRQRSQAIDAWNLTSPVLKRGLALTPVKHGISFTAMQFNQAGAMVHVYLDGSVQVNHGGTEMGQGLNTKVAQLVADELGIPVERVLATASDTSKVPNAAPTAASVGTDTNGRAAQAAAAQVRGNLAACLGKIDGCSADAVAFAQGFVHTPARSRSFAEVVKLAFAHRVQLWSDGFYSTPRIHFDKARFTGRAFLYFAYGAACTEVAIDTLTGESKVLRVDILHDVGRSINPAIDIGQIEGAFVQGMGWLTTEQLVWTDDGALSTHAPSTYKIPTSADIPEHFRVELWPEPNREDTVFKSKAVGEPPFMLSISVYEALRDAIARTHAGALNGAPPSPVCLEAPATAENVLRSIQRVPMPAASGLPPSTRSAAGQPHQQA